jgi:hypothetical protein
MIAATATLKRDDPGSGLIGRSTATVFEKSTTTASLFPSHPEVYAAIAIRKHANMSFTLVCMK